MRGALSLPHQRWCMRTLSAPLTPTLSPHEGRGRLLRRARELFSARLRAQLGHGSRAGGDGGGEAGGGRFAAQFGGQESRKERIACAGGVDGLDQFGGQSDGLAVAGGENR